MTDHHAQTSSPQSLPAPAARGSRVAFGIYLAVTIGVLVFLLWPSGRAPGTARPAPPHDADVQLARPGLIRIKVDSPLHRQLQVVDVAPERIAAPVLTVTGAVVASLRGRGQGARDWQFNSPELLATYTDWQKAVAEIAFAETQLEAIRQLTDNRVAAQKAGVERLRKLVEAGTDTERDLVTAQTDLLQAQIEGRKQLHEAETAWRLAQRTEAALSRQLQQAGVEPELLRVAPAEIDIVVADVPEASLSKVRLGQGCEARFMGIAGKVFTGTVRSIAPVLSTERRSLRVLFTIADPEDLLRPGMFADIGLGTDARDALVVPLAGVVRVGRSDFMLVRDAGHWRVAEVQVGELHDEEVEVLEGLRSGDQVVGQGAVLLKPIIVEATRPSPPDRGAR